MAAMALSMPTRSSQPVRELGVHLVSRGPESLQGFPRPMGVALLVGTQMGYPVAHDPNY